MEFKFTVEEVNTSSAFARSVPMARPNGMVVEVNDVFVPPSQAVRGLSTQLCNLTHLSPMMTRYFVQFILFALTLVACPAKFIIANTAGTPDVNTTPLVRYIQPRARQSPGNFHTILGVL